MTTKPMTIEEIAATAETATELLRRRIEQIERGRDEQPARLAKARREADDAYIRASCDEPWHTLISAIPTYNGAGERTGDSLTLPSITAKELMAARLAFDMLDCGDDHERLEETKTRYFSELGGDTGVLFLVCMAALDTVASLVVPQMVDELETRASNYDARVMLAEARANAWNGRVRELRGPQDDDEGSVGAPFGPEAGE